MEETSSEESSDFVALIELGKQLIAAARSGNTDNVIQLMHFGAPFATDWWGMTALHHAAFRGHMDIVNLLITSGILKDSRSKVDKTPLHLACQEGHSEIAQFLISNGAEVNATDMILMTPLHWAVEMNHIETVKVLMQNGAQPNLTNKFDKTCFDIAATKAYYDIFIVLKEGPQLGPSTVLDSPSITYDKGKIKTYTSGKEKKKSVTITGPVRSDLSLPKNSEVWELLEQHGIEMLEGEDVNLVAAALGSGQSVYLTEAGRQALSLTGRTRQVAASAAKSHVSSQQQTGAASAPKKLRPTTHITISPSKLSQPNIRQPDPGKERLDFELSSSPPSADDDVESVRKRAVSKMNEVTNEALVAGFYEKFLEAKKEAKHHHAMYLKKRQEAELYLKKLTMTVKSIRESDSNEVKLLNSHLNDNDMAFLDDEDGDDHYQNTIINEPLDDL